MWYGEAKTIRGGPRLTWPLPTDAGNRIGQGFMATIKEYRVAAVPANVGAFGHRQVVLLARDGEGWKIHVSVSPGIKQLAVGDVVRLETVGRYIQACSEVFFEAPEPITVRAPQNVIDLVWSDQASVMLVEAPIKR